MACYRPLAGFKSSVVNPETGKNVFFVTGGDKSFPGMEYVPIPCGRCVGCLTDRARSWTVRILHESSLYEKNCFITLTFDDKFLPPNGSLVAGGKDFRLFMRRLRKALKAVGQKVRFFHCGEYGDLLKRPHHHAVLFGFDFPDKVAMGGSGKNIFYSSEILRSLWPYGFSSVGELTEASAAYVAGYVVKKVLGAGSRRHYDGKVPEYVSMSRKPGIASDWIRLYGSDVYPDDFVVLKSGLKLRPPRFYDSVFDRDNPSDFSVIKSRRIDRCKISVDNTIDRLKVREEVSKLKLKRKERNFEKSVV